MNALCRHFGTCGGCLYQDMPDDAYRALKRDGVLRALKQHGFDDAVVEPPIEVAPRTRRRAVLKIAKRNGEVAIGFHVRESHTIVDMRECLVLTPALFALVRELRPMMDALLNNGDNAEASVTETDTGFDLSLKWNKPVTTSRTAEIARWAQMLKLARVSSGRDVLVEFATPSIRFGKAVVKLPRDAFLQPTREGEAALQQCVLEGIGNAKHVADLFAGCGTFSLVLAERARVHAVELETPMMEALADAARNTQGLKPLTIEKRDLFKVPLGGNELKPYDAVILDPPRAGAERQVIELAKSKIRRVVYVSCNPATFARDARALVNGGYRMGAVQPVDQFLWSSHTELVATFARAKA
jgi:23S rRNA (uracil1939-C5)-methyltransferase